MSGWDLLSEEAQQKLEAWPAKAQALFGELVEDAPTELQRELLQRAVAAGHSPAEIHAFADELRVLEDDEAFEACTLDANVPGGYSVVQLLRAEADPLYAYELKGNALSPADEEQGTASPTQELESLPYVAPVPSPVSGARPRSSFDSGGAAEPSGPKSRPAGFDAPTPSSGRHPRVDRNDLGQSDDATPRARPSSGPNPAVKPAAAVTARLMEDLLNEATRALGVSFREQDVDDSQLTLEAALVTAAAAVGRGIPVPVALGPALLQHRRLVLLLQTSTSSGKRAWQLYDPLSGELYWVSEKDLLARTELPFSIKTNRRITRIALPVVRASAL